MQANRTASNVYEEYESLLVPSNHGADINYRIFSGTVNWDKSPAGMKRAITVLMQYGNSIDWNNAVKELDFKMPAHILVEDLENVLLAISTITKQK